MSGDVPSRTDVLVVGGGNAGISLAARLHRMGVRDIVILEPKTVHTYRPLLSYAGAGLAQAREYQRDQADVMPAGVRWVRDAAAALDPFARTVHLAGGASVRYRQVVICAGSRPDESAEPGAAAAMRSAHASTNYLPELAPHTWELVRAMRSGRAVFTVGDSSAPCPQAGQKILYMACDLWRRRGLLGDISVTLVTPTTGVFGMPAIDAQLEPWVRRYGIRVVPGARVRGIDSDARLLRVETAQGPREIGYDLLHHTPAHRAPRWIADAGVATDAGDVAVDPVTLRHRDLPDVWACGDAAAADCSKSGGALRHQTRVLARNLVAAREGRALPERYDGYSVSPVTVERGRALVAEYDRDLRLTPTIPHAGLIRPRRAWWLLDRHVLPQQYWHAILAGR